jgi:mannosyltransferase OCH1-like enzyme
VCVAQRYELLFAFGGVYVDVDVLMLPWAAQSLNSLAASCSFFAGVSNTAVCAARCGC